MEEARHCRERADGVDELVALAMQLPRCGLCVARRTACRGTQATRRGGGLKEAYGVAAALTNVETPCFVAEGDDRPVGGERYRYTKVVLGGTPLCRYVED